MQQHCRAASELDRNPHCTLQSAASADKWQLRDGIRAAGVHGAHIHQGKAFRPEATLCTRETTFLKQHSQGVTFFHGHLRDFEE